MSTEFSPEVLEAARKYIALRDRWVHPAGRFDSGRRWYVADHFKCPACDSIRPPSRRWPYSLLIHCRTAEHVAGVAGLDVRQVRQAARLLDRAAKEAKEAKAATAA